MLLFDCNPLIMIQTISSPQSNLLRPFYPLLIFLILLLGGLCLLHFPAASESMPTELFATASGSTGITFEYEITTSDVEVEWSGGGDFDPRGKCPPDFFGEGFVLLCKKLADGAYFKFLYHKGKKLLYRIDKDIINGKARIGLHWVEGTRFNARYRIADDAFRGGKKVEVPNAKGSTDAKTFQYGQAVSKKKVQPGRELFDPTHIDPDQCPEWWDLFNFIP